jgi:hypothetical protein
VLTVITATAVLLYHNKLLALQVKKGSKVWVQATGRMLNLNGVKFFSTKDNVIDDLSGPEPVILTIGNGSVIPG